MFWRVSINYWRNTQKNKNNFETTGHRTWHIQFADPQTRRHFTEALLMSEFSSLKLIELQVYEAELDEGRQHAGMSALIGMVAQKD